MSEEIDKRHSVYCEMEPGCRCCLCTNKSLRSQLASKTQECLALAIAGKKARAWAEENLDGMDHDDDDCPADDTCTCENVRKANEAFSLTTASKQIVSDHDRVVRVETWTKAANHARFYKNEQLAKEFKLRAEDDTRSGAEGK